jgi:Fe-S-cluster-containing hydrogenase component 2
MTCTVETTRCSCATEAQAAFVALSPRNTLAFNVEACINCGMCSAVCPHGVFAPGTRERGGCRSCERMPAWSAAHVCATVPPARCSWIAAWGARRR